MAVAVAESLSTMKGMSRYRLTRRNVSRLGLRQQSPTTGIYREKGDTVATQ
ncbi:hypothetical protein ACLB1Q_10840 [Escherichia coli]